MNHYMHRSIDLLTAFTCQNLTRKLKIIADDFNIGNFFFWSINVSLVSPINNYIFIQLEREMNRVRLFEWSVFSPTYFTTTCEKLMFRYMFWSYFSKTRWRSVLLNVCFFRGMLNLYFLKCLFFPKREKCHVYSQKI